MNRGMRLQNYQRTFLRVNTPPPPPPHLTISFLQLSFPLPSSPSSPPPPFSPSRYGSVPMNPFVDRNDLSTMRSEITSYQNPLSKESSEGRWLWRDATLFLVLLIRRRVKWVFDEDPIQGDAFDTSFCLFFITYLDYRVSKIECEEKERKISNHFRYMYRHVLTLFQYEIERFLVPS